MTKAFAKLFFLFGLSVSLSCFSIDGVSKTEPLFPQCVVNLPPVVIVNHDMRDMNFSKSKFVDAFWNYEDQQKGQGYASFYDNSFCHAKVSLYQDDMGRLSNNKIKRSLKDEISFPYQKQYNKKIGKVKFYGAYGQDGDFSNILLLGKYQKHVLKVRMSCVNLPRFSVEEYTRKIDDMVTIFTESVVSSLDNCLN